MQSSRRGLTLKPSKKANKTSGEYQKPDVYKMKYTYKKGIGQRKTEEVKRPKVLLRPARRAYTPIEHEKLKREKQLPQAHTKKISLDSGTSTLPLHPDSKKSELYRKVTTVISEAKEHLRHIDYVTVLAVALLSVIGILAVHSATLSKGSSRFDVMQIGMTCVGFLLMLGLSYLDYEGLTKNYRYILILNVAMLLFTALFGTGPENAEGAVTNRNWIRIGPVGVQPAEFGKILFIITFSAHLDAVKHRINNIKTLLGLLLHAGLIIGIVLLQRDLGQATVYLAIMIVMLFAARLSMWYFIGAGVGAVAAAPVVWSLLAEYQKKRIMVGFNPELDPLDKGYQVIWSKTAIGAGGVTGLGYREGLVSQTEILPAKWTDMIFAVIAEEAGFIGACLVLLLLAILVMRTFMNGLSCDRMSGSLILAGVGGMFMYQVIENIGMCLGMLPVVGITLPFLSYGGSSVLAMYLAVGLSLSVYAKNHRLFFGGSLGRMR